MKKQKKMTKEMKNFERSMRKARALVDMWEVLDNLFSGKFAKKLEELMDITKILIDEEDLKDIEKEMKKRMKVKVEKNQKQMEKDIKKYFKGMEKRIEKFFTSLQLGHGEILLEQAVAMSVSAFEIYLKDTLIHYVNKDVKIRGKFNDEIKRQLNLERVTDYGFDLKHRIGNLTFGEWNFFNVKKVDEFYKKIFLHHRVYIDDSLERKIMRFIELRHIVVHNRGIIDVKFKSRTKTRYSVKDRYPINKGYILQMFNKLELVVTRLDKVRLETKSKRKSIR